ncbi:MAG: PVC-type heme-binding CxxCH protein [Pirellulales bacterium]
MLRSFWALGLSALALLAAIPAVNADEPAYPASLVAPTEPLTPEQQRTKFRLPPGFEIQLVASEPDIHKPMNMNFDAQGRLYVTSSLEYPYPAGEGSPHRDALHVLVDENGDGRADRVTRLVDGLNIPLGVTPIDGGVLYYSIPNIYRTPPDGGPHEKSELAYSEFGYRDTHGMANSFTRWIDGWIYACHGFANDSQVAGQDGHQVTMHSGNTFRMRADGSRVEQYTHGQVNPFGLAFDPLGNLFSADCHTLPIYQLLRGAWYPSFGKPHDGLGFGPTMIGHDHGSTGIGGVVYYAADHFPAEYRDTVFIGNPVTGKVNRDRLEVHGSTFKAIEQPDFIACDDPWFRPVDLQLGPDGALYVADFYNCIIGHYEVPLTHPRRDRHRGRIWRVVYTGGQTKPATTIPDLTRLPAEKLVELLGTDNLTLRVLATEALVGRSASGGKLPDGLLPHGDDSQPSAWRRAHGMWVAERLKGLDDAAVERLAGDPSALVRVHLVKLLAERPDWNASDLDIALLVRSKLADPDAFVRRAAADSLGRHPDPANLPLLLDLWSSTPAEDTHLVHVARMALRDQLLAPSMYAAAQELMAQDDSYRGRLAEVSLGVHTPAAAEFLLACLADDRLGGASLGSAVYEAARYAAENKLGNVFQVAEGLDLRPNEQREVLLALHRAVQSRGRALPETTLGWAGRLAKQLLADDRPGRVQGGIELARELRLGLYDELHQIAAAGSRFANLRSAAIDACMANEPVRSVGLLSEIIGDAGEPMALRQKASASLAGINDPAAQGELTRHLLAAPERLAVEIAAGLALRPEGAHTLLDQVQAGKASPRLLQERVVQERLRAINRRELDQRLSELTANLPPADERIRQLIHQRREAFAAAETNADQGRVVFKKTCAACHRLNGEGTKIGPDLEGIGLRGADRLLEDMLDPSRNVDQAFRSTVLTTVNGDSISGLLLQEEGEVLVLADAEGKEVRVPASDIDERSLTQLSPMPGNVADLVKDEEFFNLLAYLLEQRQKEE